ncbi:DUF2634 domain-containing protein [Salibacterium halotolerans]|uniref:DUF2634 domain-containing protein n=1 Tax=Salibacterium halotolerans TaxID=1884432 RepID=A0A1I5NBH9_9BACI|nr:DUF2634 domain-containing protein [Salibacterium halotolerans]SFP19094.1 Protein of unknown function [Salibacterium halotolerans]
MKALKVDKQTGDLAMENGDFVWIEDHEELLQEIRSVLKTALEEWFLDPMFGTEYEAIQGKDISDDDVTQTIYDALEQVERVTAVTDIQIERDGERQLSVFFRCYAGEEEVTGTEVMNL